MGFVNLDPVVVMIAVGFALSIFLNFLILAVLSLTEQPLQHALWILFALDAMLVGLMVRKIKGEGLGLLSTNPVVWLLIAVMFAVMLQNGGLVDHLADSWWHMSYANKMILRDTVFLSTHHFGGDQLSEMALVYEPGWHSNLALLGIATDYPLPLIWHSLGPWCFSVAVMSYYLLVLALTDNKKLALLSVVLFIVVFGGINSFARVAPWPGNVAYSIFYMALALLFLVLENSGKCLSSSQQHVPMWTKLKCSLHGQVGLLILLLLLLTAIFTLHLAELVWFVSSLAFYSYALWILAIEKEGAPSKLGMRGDAEYLGLLWVFYLMMLVWLALERGGDLAFTLGVTLYVLIFAMVFRSLLRWRRAEVRGRNLLGVTFGVLAVLLIVDSLHLVELFSPSYHAVPVTDRYVPKHVVGYFNEDLRLPNWDHQLRPGLLLAGIAGVVSSIVLLMTVRSRATVFFCANALIAFVLITSPYLFTYFGLVLPIDRIYRFQTLIFHPVILAFVLWVCYEKSVCRRVFRLGTSEEL